MASAANPAAPAESGPPDRAQAGLGSRRSRRQRATTWLTSLAVLLAMLALVLAYAGTALLRPGPFADRAVATLRSPAVSDDVADRVTSAIVSGRGEDLVAIRPVIRAVAGSIVRSGAFAALFRTAVLATHTAVVQRHGETVLVKVADAVVLVQGALERFAPSAARRIDTQRIIDLLRVRPGDGLLAIVRVARTVYAVTWVLAILGAALAALAIALSDDRPRALARLGAGIACGGLLLAAAYQIGLVAVSHVAPSGRGPAARALWSAFLGGLQVQALWAAAAGTVLVAVAGAWRPAQAAVERAAGGRRLWTGESLTPAMGLVRSAVLVLLGVGILLAPGAALSIAILLVGLYVLYRGASAALDAAARARPKLALARPAVGKGLGLLAPAVGLIALAVAAVVIVTGGGDEAPAATPPTCNGYAALCNRTLNQVAFAATHNSMASVTIPTFLFGQQDGTIADQLDFGIRGLLIDTYYGDAVPRGVRTDLASLPKRAAAVAEVGAPAVEAAERIRSRLGHQGKGRRGIYLCHGFCEVGAVPLDSTLADIRAFLVSNPGEVMIVINQDEGVSPADIQRAFEKSGLLDLVYRGPLGPFPTLRTMIDSNERLVIMAENDAGDIPWYHLAYEHALQETPFRFTRAAQLTQPSEVPASCADNRGTASAPLFLLNNWVDTTPLPRPSLAAEVNARDALLDRAQTCQRMRGRLPNLVAVDFYRRGDVLGVVRFLNGLG